MSTETSFRSLIVEPTGPEDALREPPDGGSGAALATRRRRLAGEQSRVVRELRRPCGEGLTRRAS